jgi:hypothetical protein
VEKPSDAEALQYHYEDLVDGTGDGTEVVKKAGEGKMGKMRYVLNYFNHFIFFDFDFDFDFDLYSPSLGFGSWGEGDGRWEVHT